MLNDFGKKDFKQSKYRPETKEELKALCDDLSVNLGDIDTSKITNMCGLFKETKRTDFSGIEDWDVSSVINMSGTFSGYGDSVNPFNVDISNWDVSNVKDMSRMFANSQFNGDLSKWDVSNVRDMEGMFILCPFSRDISAWDVSNVKNSDLIFENCSITADQVPEKFKGLVTNRQQGQLSEKKVKKGRSR